MPSVGLVDYGSGNYRSVANALAHLAIDVQRIERAEQLDGVDRIILPGVGAFAHVMSRLHETGLADGIERHVRGLGKPFLGICVGMQVLAAVGHEFQESAGLGWIPGETHRITAAEQGLPVPHMGWNELELCVQSPLFEGLSALPVFYFVHSYELRPADERVVVATAEHGGKVVAAVQSGHIYGVQFHPEKSQRDGLRLLANFARL